MSERAAYSRVYWSIVDDPKFATVFDNDHHLAAWLRLLLIADQAHPASAHLPSNVRRASVKALADVGLIDLSGSRYRVHGLDAERERRRVAAGGRKPPERDPDGTQSGPERDPTGIQTSGLRRAETRQDETSQADARADVDALDTYWTLTGKYPNGRSKEWLEALVNEFDHHRVSAALGAEASGERQGLIGRVQNRLRSEADKAAKAAAEQSLERLRQDAIAKRISPEEAEAKRAAVKAELLRMTAKVTA